MGRISIQTIRRNVRQGLHALRMIDRSLDGMSAFVGRLCIALIVMGGVYVGMQALAPGWFDGVMNGALNAIHSYGTLP
jgi:hypothetical protein